MELSISHFRSITQSMLVLLGDFGNLVAVYIFKRGNWSVGAMWRTS
ncbi:MAG TPA: hypothetical protein VN753_11855 [Terracidiphilus sp.]|nr:hypothetical protein [Terracidiphilus sp.]